MKAEEIIGIFTSDAPGIHEIVGLYIGGSYGAGCADRFSDFDFVAISEPENTPLVVKAWEDLCHSHFDVVFCRKQVGKAALVNMITSGWTRIDLYVESKDDFLKRAQDQLKPVFEREQLFDKLSNLEPPYKTSVAKLEFLANEYLRTLGLLAVGIGRNELFLCDVGLGHLKSLFMSFAIETERSRECGALNLRRSLTKQTHELFESLPNAGAERRDIIAAHMETTRMFLEYAKPVFKEMELDWPGRFEIATRAHLVQALGEEVSF
ncbi:hypothetical protein [Maritalea porphyrae]|uniref:Nucleotidyltransferase domain-containing protein n=1 Tax=Maritalea porphyrae TaxID=880732 RepID=A0ABQ5UV21_9HYPH|nr:hypothetical protein [Maritalea porphyrae]GLQ18542.1 hypothetical protein GCM10007879_27910 [Maritalea porphyrae]